MEPYGEKYYLKKKVSYQTQKSLKRISILNIKLIHQIFDTLFFLSLDSQKKWSNTYENISKTKTMNNNLIDYISKTEEFYIGELESLNNYRKTKPKDLIYLDRISEEKKSFFKKNLRSFIEGVRDSKYQKGY